MCKALKILALEPFYGGSHRAFLDGWKQHSHHSIQVLGLPDYKWKWRMRHAGLTFARQASALLQSGNNWDVVWCSDMLNLPDFLALSDPQVASLSRIIYFHENQFSYPNRKVDERDFHFAFSNYVSALSADAVWFNSQFHQADFLTTCESFLKRMPDHSEVENVEAIRVNSEVQYPGIDEITAKQKKNVGAVRILWNARWEHDKNPYDFFQAIRCLRSQGVEFELNVLGQSFAKAPPEFEAAKNEFNNQIDHWGYASSRQDYFRILRESDVVVSTATHEFFGMGVVEAMNAGVVPLLPTRLAYPELLAPLPDPSFNLLMYDGTVDGLVEKFRRLEIVRNSSNWQELVQQVVQCGRRFEWKGRATSMDAAVSAVHQQHHER